MWAVSERTYSYVYEFFDCNGSDRYMQSRCTVNSGYLTLYISESYPCCLLDAVRIRGPDNVVELAQH